MGRTAFLGVLCLLLVAGVITPVAAQSNDDTPGWTWYNETDNDFNLTELRSLFNGDQEVDPYDYNDTLSDAGIQRVLAVAGDMDTVRPPSARPQTWNKRDVEDFNDGDSDTSIYPEEADTTGGTVVKDAYIETFSVAPSTYMHISQSKSNLYVRPSGSLRGTTDYRITKGDGTNCTPAFVGSTCTGYSFVSGTVREIQVYQKQTGVKRPVGTGNVEDDGTWTATFSDLRPGDSTLIVETTYTVKYVKVENTKREYCVDYDTIEQVCEETETYTVTERTQKKESVIVRDDVPVFVYSPNPSAEVAKHPDGGMRVYLEPGGVSWDHLNLGDGRTANNGWFYYTKRDPGWDRMVTETDDKRYTNRSKIRPAISHGFPQKNGVFFVKEQHTLGIRQAKEQTYASPTLGQNITVQRVPNATYTYAFALDIRSQQWNPSLNGYSVQGVVPGETYDISVYDRSTLVRPTIYAKFINGSQATENVTVEVGVKHPETGTFLTTKRTSAQQRVSGEDPSYVTVNGKQVELSVGNLTKNVTVKARSPHVTVTYHPQVWYAQRGDDRYLKNSTTIPTSKSGSDLLGPVFNIIFIDLLPLWVALWLLDQATGDGVTLWPPWQWIRNILY